MSTQTIIFSIATISITHAVGSVVRVGFRQLFRGCFVNSCLSIADDPAQTWIARIVGATLQGLLFSSR